MREHVHRYSYKRTHQSESDDRRNRVFQLGFEFIDLLLTVIKFGLYEMRKMEDVRENERESERKSENKRARAKE